MPLDTAVLAAHRHRIYGFALRFTGCPDDAADVTQDVLVRLWRHGDSVDPERRTAWTLRVTRNACIDMLRARKARHAHTLPAPVLVDIAPDDAHSPAHLTESADLRVHLEQAIADLDEPYRSIIWLREVDDLSYQEIADALELPLNTLKVYLHRARKRLRDTLRPILLSEDQPA